MEQLIESELAAVLWATLETQYGLTGSTLYRYLSLRSRVERVQKGNVGKGKEEPAGRHLTRFLLKEWALEENETVRFQGEEIQLICAGRTGVHRIVADWHVESTYRYAPGQFNQLIEEEWKRFVQDAKKRVRKWSKMPFYDIALKKAYLHVLNSAYEVKGEAETVILEDLQTQVERFPLRLELQYDRLLHPYFIRHQDISLVDERAIEEYVARHLEDIEEGLRLIGSQIVLERGRIDLLARDASGRNVVIEVKVATDTDLVWQQTYYMKEIQKRYGGDVRFMVVAPKWEGHIMEMLLEIPNTEIQLFKAELEQRKIRSLSFRKRAAS